MPLTKPLPMRAHRAGHSALRRDAQLPGGIGARVQGDFRSAVAAARTATEEEPTNWRTWLALSRLEARTGDAEAALAAFREARRLNPRSPLIRRRVMHETEKDHDELSSLARASTAPKPGLQIALRSHLLAKAERRAPRPARLRLLIATYAASGATLLLIAAVGIAGAGRARPEVRPDRGAFTRIKQRAQAS